MRKFIKKSLVAIMTAAMVISSFGSMGAKVEAATSGYTLQNKSVKELMTEYGLIAFGRADINVHCHSNYLVHTLNLEPNSGLKEKYKVAETFYFKEAESLNSNICDAYYADTAVVYTETDVVPTDNGNKNDVKLKSGAYKTVDFPKKIIKNTQFANMSDIQKKYITYNQLISKQANKGIVEVSLNADENNRYMKVGAGVNYRTFKPEDLIRANNTPIYFDFSDYSNDDILVLNIDLQGKTAVNFGSMPLRNGSGKINCSEDSFLYKYNRVYFNFYDGSKADRQYTGSITFTAEGFGTIIAPSASVSLGANWDGMVVANNVALTAGQYHRVNGTGIPEFNADGTPVVPGTGSDTPGTGSDTPGTGSDTPGTGSDTPGTGSDTPGTGSDTPGTGSDTPGTGSAAQGTGDLSITIKDEKTDKPVPGATVEITSPDGSKTEHVTNEEGSIVINGVPVGNYLVVVKDVPSGYNVTTGKEVEVIVEKGKSNNKTVTKNTTDAKNAKKALKHAADIKTGDEDFSQSAIVKNTSVTPIGAKNNNKINKTYNKKLKSYKKKHKKQSKEIAAWVTVAGTRVDYPVMYSGLKNNAKYIDKNIDGKKDSHGMLFASYITPKRTITYNSIIYGHNMKDGTMFGELDKYASKSFYKKNKYVKLDTQGYNYVYEIVEVIRVSCKKGSKDRMIYEKFADLDNKKVFKKWKKQVTKNREYKCSGKYSRSDNLLMLSTCEYQKENGRLALICKQVKCKKVKK